MAKILIINSPYRVGGVTTQVVDIIVKRVNFSQNSLEVMALASLKAGAKAPVPSFGRTLVKEFHLISLQAQKLHRTLQR